MRRSITVCLVAICTLLVGVTFAGAQPPPPKPIPSIYGTAEDGVYTNKRLGFSLEYPKDWVMADRATTTTAARVGVDTIKGNNRRDNREIEAALVGEIPLINVMKKPLGAIGNAGFTMVARKQASPNVTAAMVAEATKSLFDSSPTLKLLDGPRAMTVSGRKFSMLHYEINVNGQRANIKVYFTMIDGYALTFSLSYSDDNDLTVLNNIVDSLKFTGR